MTRYEWMVPCHFGTEAVCKREIEKLGYPICKVEDGKVHFTGDLAAMCRANVFLRTAERVLLKVSSFPAKSFDELFERTKEIPWEEYIPRDGRFWVTKANSLNSQLFSPSDIQSIVKKAMVERMKTKYKQNWFDETGAPYPIRITIRKDEVTIGLDATGESLHKRGYRKMTAKAPITETLAAALIMLTPWKKDRILVDPFCGSGTIPIEAALMGADIAPGMRRSFLAEEWTNLLDKKAWMDARSEAESKVNKDYEMNIQAYDIDEEAIRMARINAGLAGVEDRIHFQKRAIKDLSHPKKYGFIITNPPYGERLEEAYDLQAIYREMGEAFRKLDTWSHYVISGYDDAQKYIGRKADKNRKVYNGMMKTYFYQYIGPKPPKMGKDAKGR